MINQTITEAGVSVINVGGVAFLRYSKIFQRKDGLKFNIPIAIITDSDVNTYEKKDDSIKKLSDGEISTKRLIKLESARRKYNYDDYIKVFLALDWTFEYALYSSKTFNVVFEKIVKEIHSRSNWTDFESELANKLLHQSLSKTEIAYKLAMELKNNPKLLELTSNDLENDKPIAYLVEALKFVCK